MAGVLAKTTVWFLSSSGQTYFYLASLFQFVLSSYVSDNFLVSDILFFGFLIYMVVRIIPVDFQQTAQHYFPDDRNLHFSLGFVSFV
jgi:hypothetical protein